MRCNDCGWEISTENLEENEVVECSSCGCDYVYMEGKLIPLVLRDGIDWGE